ncbi:putative signal transducing protein [Dokdonia sp. LLG6352-1]|uniref:putative signal transducing protein n=1 Tax=Dokdonia sp. LLG6352-1 TaxID=3160831 RepID=UPI00386F8429
MSILSDSRYEKIHTGSAIETKRLQIILEEKGIPSILRDDNESAKLAGYALGSPDQSRLLVDKEHLVKAKHIVAATLEDFKTNALTDDELNSLSQEESQSTPIKTITRNTTEKKKPGVSPGRLIFYVLFLLYSLWRLSPLLKGEELPMLRIIISGALSIFCIYMLISYFTNKK